MGRCCHDRDEVKVKSAIMEKFSNPVLSTLRNFEDDAILGQKEMA